MVEMIQNISKHAVPSENGCHEGLFSFGKCGQEYSVTASNYVDSNSTDRLKAYIKDLNSKSREQLDEYYKQVLRNGHDNLEIASGLGLIDIARESKDGILVQTDTYDNKSLLTIECQV